MSLPGAPEVLGLAAGFFPEGDDDEHTMLTRLRASVPSFVPTWLSALAATGVELPPELAAELDGSRRRVNCFRELLGDIVSRYPETHPMKGIAVVDAYPEPLARHMNDIDVVVPGEDALWELVGYLGAEHGMSIVKSVARVPVDSGAALLVSVEAPPDNPLRQRFNVEICSAAWLGNGAAVRSRRAPLATRYGPTEHLAMIVAERLEGQFSPKDVLDAAVLGAVMTSSDLHRLTELSRQLQVVPELRELIELVARHGLDFPAEPPSEQAARRSVWSRRLRLAAAARTEPVPAALRYLQRSEVFDCFGRSPRRRAWRALDRRISVQSPYRDQLWGFAVPVASVDAGLRAGLRSPVGDFLIVSSATVGARWQALEGIVFDA